MLFNSFEYILLFLPITLVVYFVLLRKHLTIAAKFWLFFASLFFYSWWNVKYTPLILGSIFFNYTIGGMLENNGATGNSTSLRKLIFVFGVAANVILLCYFKYMDFFIGNFNALAGMRLPLLHIVLPLGISFFTITQIAFLVDAYEGLVEERDLLNYALFVTFFPHLLAGPILHHSEMMPQFDRLRNKVVNWKNLYLGLALFFIGLLKKVVVADQFALWANAGFDAAQSLNFFEAWLASLSYTFQLYFDFSGYSDMAVGVGWMFNIRLPINFNSPYKATSIIDFWKRWHITLTNFVTSYLYTPLLRSFSHITFTASLSAIFMAMLISGFWHGSGWTYVVWGGMHGAALIVNHVWRKNKLKMTPVLGWALTLGFVNISFVFFRAKNWEASLKVLTGMAAMNGVMVPVPLSNFSLMKRIPVSFGPWLGAISGSYLTFSYILVALLIAVLGKNSIQLVDSFRPTRWHALILGVMINAACWTLTRTNKVSEFLYFQF